MEQTIEFMPLFLRYQTEIRAFIGSLVRDPHVREDLFQEVALILWREFAEYDPTRSFGAWARGIAANKVMQQFSKSARLPLSFSPTAVQAIVEAHDQDEANEPLQAEALEHCVEQLPPRSRTLLQLRYQKALKLEEIAREVRSTLHAVHMALSRLRSRLAECIQARSRILRGNES